MFISPVHKTVNAVGIDVGHKNGHGVRDDHESFRGVLRGRANVRVGDQPESDFSPRK